MTQSDIHLTVRPSGPKASYYNDGHAAGYQKCLEDHGLTPNLTAGTLVADPGYETLVAIFRDAHHHAARLKGKERHANDLPFEDQRMISISRLLSSANGMAYQVIKKITEGLALPEYHRTRAELLGALNYLAGIVILLDEKQGAPTPDELATAEMLKSARACSTCHDSCVVTSAGGQITQCPDCRGDK